MASGCPHQKARLSPQARRYHQTLTRMMMGIEATFAKKILAEKRRTISAYVRLYLGTHSTSSPLLEDQHAANMVEIYNKTMGHVIRTFSGYAMERRGKSIKADRFQHLEMMWASKHGAKRIADASRTTIRDIQAALIRSAEEMETTVQTAARIRGVSVLSAFRSQVIAQTEVHSGAMFASIETDRAEARDAGTQIEKAWVSTEDEVTRPWHLDMDPDEFIPEDSTFNVDGESMDYPGDPSGSPENIINCRCVVITQEVESTAGWGE